MKKKRLLVDARSFTGEGQGMRTYIKGLYNAFYHQYPEYELFFAGYDYEDLKESFPFLKEEHFIRLKNQSRLKLFCWEFPKIIRAKQIDFAHFQYVTPFIKNCTFITTTHDLLFLDFKEEFGWLYRIKRKLLFHLSLLRSEIKLTVSEYSLKQLSFHFGIPPNEVGITSNAVSQDFFQPYNKTGIQKYLTNKYGISNYLLYVSRIEPRKNHLLLLEAYEELNLAAQNKQLVLIGNNTLNDQLINEKVNALKEKFPNKVHWLKYVDFKELINFYQGADLFVFPSKAEGFGIPPIEAGALGINTLCADNTAMSDFTFFGDNLFNAEDKAAFKRKLLENIQNPKNRAQLKSITEQIKRTYNWEKSAMVLQEKIKQTETFHLPINRQSKESKAA